MKTIHYLFSIFALIVRGIVSIVLIVAGIFFIGIMLGTGGPSLFLVNLALRVGLFFVGALLFLIGIKVWTVRIDWKKILTAFGNCHIYC